MSYIKFKYNAEAREWVTTNFALRINASSVKHWGNTINAIRQHLGQRRPTLTIPSGKDSYYHTKTDARWATINYEMFFNSETDAILAIMHF